jgi:hypothetical protein
VILQALPTPRRVVPCQGRACNSRGICAHFYAFSLPNREPVDRLCPPGEEEPESIETYLQPQKDMKK